VKLLSADAIWDCSTAPHLIILIDRACSESEHRVLQNTYLLARELVVMFHVVSSTISPDPDSYMVPSYNLHGALQGSFHKNQQHDVHCNWVVIG